MKSLKREMVFDRTLGKLRPMGLAPVASSAHLKWRGYHLEHQRLSSVERREVIWLNNMVFVHRRPITIEWKQQSRFVPRRIQAGDAVIVPPQGVTDSRVRSRVDVVALAIEPTFMVAACGEMAASEHFELRLVHGVTDPFVKGVCLALLEEVERGGKSGLLYADSLVTGLAIHLASRYSSRKTGRRPSGCPRFVRRAQLFITDHLERDLTLGDIAAAVNLSPFHFSRVFKQHTGLSPYQFLLQQRIERARQLLVRGQHSVSGVALEVGFYDQSHFTLHFKRLSGMTPGQFVAQCHHRKGRPVLEASTDSEASEPH
jgi:AraC family transcriptional regulator